MKLCDIPPCSAAVIINAEESASGGRLSGLGLTSGAVVVRLFSAPSGDPTAYLVRGAVTAIRRSDAESITVGEVTR